jgi:hypothetical protein
MLVYFHEETTFTGSQQFLKWTDYMTHLLISDYYFLRPGLVALGNVALSAGILCLPCGNRGGVAAEGIGWFDGRISKGQLRGYF